MKTPAPPPELTAIVERIGTDRLLKLMTGQSNVLTGEYLSWDKLRFKTPPEGLTSEEWWLQLRLARRGAERPTPQLVQKNGEPFTYTLPDVLLRLNDEVTRQTSGQISIAEAVTSPDTRDRYVISSLIEEAITSSQLEGAATSRRVAKDMIQSGRQPRDHSETMILNNYLAMQRVVELRDSKMTPELVCELHRIVTEGTLDDPSAAGAIQDDDATRIAVWGDGEQLLHRPPPVAELPDRLRNLCAFANNEFSDDDTYLPPLLRAVGVHFMMGYDHYFEDGNGRTARALFYWCMLREGFWLTEFLTISRILKQAPSKYAQSFLLTEDDGGDLTHFFVYQLRVITRAVDELHKYLAAKAQELRALQVRLNTTARSYNHRQLALLEYAVRMPEAVFTARSHASKHRVTEQSARNDLTDLTSRGLLVPARQGRRHAWVPAPDLQKRLDTVT